MKGVEQSHELFPAVAVGDDNSNGVSGGAVGRAPRAPGPQHSHAGLHLGLRQQDGRGRHVDGPTCNSSDNTTVTAATACLEVQPVPGESK